MPDHDTPKVSSEADKSSIDTPADQSHQPVNRVQITQQQLQDLVDQESIGTIEPLSDGEVVYEILAKVPATLKLFNRMRLVATTVYDMATLNVAAKEMPLPPVLSQAPGFLGFFRSLPLIASIINFLTLPMVFLASRILHKESPVTLTKVGEWVYSAVMLGLVLAATFAGPLAAPIIGMVVAGLGFLYSLYLAGHFSTEKKEVKTQLADIEKQIQEKKLEIEENKDDIKEFLTALQTPDSKQLASDEELILYYYTKLRTQNEQLNKLVTKKAHLNQELSAYDDSAEQSYVLGFGVSTVVMLGTAIAFFNPAFGFGMVTAASMIGVGYALVSMAMPLITAGWKTLTGWFRSHFDKPAENESLSPSNDKTLISTDNLDVDISDTASSQRLQEPIMSDDPAHRYEYLNPNPKPKLKLKPDQEEHGESDGYSPKK